MRIGDKFLIKNKNTGKDVILTLTLIDYDFHFKYINEHGDLRTWTVGNSSLKQRIRQGNIKPYQPIKNFNLPMRGDLCLNKKQ